MSTERRTIGVFFNEPDKYGYPYGDPDYLASYRDFSGFCAKRGVQLVIVRGASNYQGNMTFSHGWKFEGDELVAVDGPLTVDLIYNKELGHELVTNPGDLVMNDPVFDRIGRDKWLTAQAFPTLVPPTYQIDNNNWQEVLGKIASEKVVLKPISGTEGRGILVEPTATLDFPSLGIDTPYIAQEFVDSSAGIPGLCTGMHDLRVLMFNGEPKLSFLRQPKSGSYLSNTAQGGSLETVDIERVPKQILEAAAIIDEHYKEFQPRFYTADFFMQGERPYLIETNTRPGFPYAKSEGPEFTKKFFTYLFDLLKEALATKAGA